MTSSFKSWMITFSALFSKSVPFLTFSDVNIKQTILDIWPKQGLKDLFPATKIVEKEHPDKWRFLLPLQYPYHSPQYPIVLCHGLGFFEKTPSSLPKFQLHYWGSIVESLKKLGCQVYVTKVPSTGTIAQRARELTKQLSSMVNGRRVNLVAHSMGGLDCRYLLSKRLYKDFYPVSLTTLSCPHRGSPFMDWCRDYLGLGRVFPRVSGTLKEEVFYNSCKKYENSSSISSTILSSIMFSQTMDTPAYANLTTTYLKESFNPFILDSLEVKYYSFAAVSSVPIWHPLYFPNHIVSQAEGMDNDGLVSVKSATWGKLLGILECDHWELRGRGLGAGTGFIKQNFDVDDFYCALATHLWNENF
ncbi:hypothetical protein PNEG_00185 [Pneumocystis murina B123]|uniref:DUF676 domain-containing protein n=1 Tax=Pneumocystis murina (strain B123) TaxID=1069680 RepID=M7NSN4_PNEMU|nr:hypothetical protein PNEG_00185 [Pneumocystis murina B123]EMR11753.1 hypothetical protein PNEG_00185 [Pneumocystis murina B123]